jgi:hypothetical protein
VELVSIATRIPPERICALEEGLLELPPNGSSRVMARALAEAIGADPDEAAARIGGYTEPEDSPRWSRRSRGVVIGVVLVLLSLGGIAWLWKVSSEGGAETAESTEEGVEEPGVVRRPDHLFRLLAEPEG